MTEVYEVKRLNDEWKWEPVDGLPSLSKEDIFCMVDEQGERVADERGFIMWMVNSLHYDDDGDPYVNAQPVLAAE